MGSLPSYPLLPATEIVDRIWLGPYLNAIDVKWLKTHRITHIVSVTNQTYLYPRHLNITHKEIRIADDPTAAMLPHIQTLVPYLQEVVKNKRANVLLHCHRGMSRSATIMVAYLMITQNMCRDAALLFVRSKRKRIQPNDGFMSELTQLETKRKKQ